MVSGLGDAVGRATPLRGRVAVRAHFGAPCILDEPGVGVCLDCGQSAPYQNFGHDPKIGLCLDGCHFFGMLMNSSQL